MFSLRSLYPPHPTSKKNVPQIKVGRYSRKKSENKIWGVLMTMDQKIAFFVLIKRGFILCQANSDWIKSMLTNAQLETTEITIILQKG